MFFTFEGIDGSGKSTLVSTLRKQLENQGHSVYQTREPGGSDTAEKLRELLLDPSTSFTPVSELFAMQAARIDHYQRCIEPALSRGQIVLCDRYYDSTLMYQGVLRGLGVETCHAIIRAGLDMIRAREPDATFLLDVEIETSLQRRPIANDDEFDAVSAERRNGMIQGYRDLALRFPDRIQRVDANHSAVRVLQEVVQRMKPILNSPAAQLTP